MGKPDNHTIFAKQSKNMAIKISVSHISKSYHKNRTINWIERYATQY